jgi:hypothetical protein
MHNKGVVIRGKQAPCPSIPNPLTPTAGGRMRQHSRIMAKYDYERKTQWDFKAGEGTAYLAYLYLDGKEGSAVAVGQNYHHYSEQKKLLTPENYPGMKSYSNYTGPKEIPAQITQDGKNYTVRKIAKWAFYSAIDVNRVMLPSTIEEIEDEAFLYETGLNILELNEGLKRIGKEAFFWCTRLDSVLIPDSVTDLGPHAFEECERMRKAIIGAGITSMDDVFKGCLDLQEVTCRAVNPPVITEETFTSKTYQNATLFVPFLSLEDYKKAANWKKFGKIEPIPETIPTTGKFYFMVDGIRYVTKGDNSNEVYVAPLEEGVYGPKYREVAKVIEIPSQVEFANKIYTVTGIGQYAFRDSKMPSVTIPETVKDIDYAAFKNSKMTSIVIPSTVQYIKDSAFLCCENLTEIDVPGSVAYIEDSAFGYCKNLKKITLHKGLKRIGDCAFEGATEVQQLTIPDTVVEIGAGAFNRVCYNSTNRLTLTIPDSVLTIGYNAFFECRIKKLTLGKGLTKIEDGAFRKSELKEVVIPANITSIGIKAFADNDNNFQTITCESATPPQIEENTFDALTFENTTLKMPTDARNAYKSDAVWGKFSQFTKEISEEKPVNPESTKEPEPTEEPEPIREISKPIRYITLINNADFYATVILHCDRGDVTIGEVSQKEDMTIDIRNYPRVSTESKVWLEIVVKGKSQIASQRFVFGMKSDVKASYTIKSSTNILSYTGLTTY